MGAGGGRVGGTSPRTSIAEGSVAGFGGLYALGPRGARISSCGSLICRHFVSGLMRYARLWSYNMGSRSKAEIQAEIRNGKRHGHVRRGRMDREQHARKTYFLGGRLLFISRRWPPFHPGVVARWRERRPDNRSCRSSWLARDSLAPLVQSTDTWTTIGSCRCWLWWSRSSYAR